MVRPRLGHTTLGFENLLLVLCGKCKMASKHLFFAKWLELLSKNWFSVANLNFSHKAGSKSNLYFSLITTVKLENLQLKFLKCLNKFSIYWRKTGFRQPFCIFHTKPEVDFQNQGSCALIEVQLENMPFKFWKNRDKFSSYGGTKSWQTDTHTCRQTDGNKVWY